MAGVLKGGEVLDHAEKDVLAEVLQIARRHALAIEPVEDQGTIQVRQVLPGVLLAGLRPEQQALPSLVHGIISPPPCGASCKLSPFFPARCRFSADSVSCIRSRLPPAVSPCRKPLIRVRVRRHDPLRGCAPYRPDSARASGLLARLVALPLYRRPCRPGRRFPMFTRSRIRRLFVRTPRTGPKSAFRRRPRSAWAWSTSRPAHAGPDFVLGTLADVVDANDGVLSLREAITQANQTTEADKITIPSSLFSQQPIQS